MLIMFWFLLYIKNNFLRKIAGMFLQRFSFKTVLSLKIMTSVEESAYENTLTNQSVGDGSSGAIDDYFYDFNDAVDAKFLDIQNQGSALHMIST